MAQLLGFLFSSSLSLILYLISSDKNTRFCNFRGKINFSYFNNFESMIELKSFFILSMLDWARALQAFSCDSFLDLLEHCSLKC